MIDGEEIALIVRYWHDLQSNTSQVQVVRVATGEEVHLSDGNFLLRIFSAEHGAVIRCFVRHLASGREAYLQSGANLRTFVNACLLNEPDTAEQLSPTPEPEHPPETTSQEHGDDPGV